jgi:ABC-2 type transport system ATP-binding protein
MININGLCFDYPGKRALDHLSFSIEPNTITALVGPNGAGKTTLLRCLAALDSPTIGTIMIDGIDTERFPRKIHERVSYLSDIFGLYDELTVRQSLVFFASSHLCPSSVIPQRIESTVDALHLREYIDVQAGKLSRGLRQRLAIAQTIIHQPKILILDEPASGLDPESRYNLSKLFLDLQKSGITLIVSSHILSELEDYCTHMIILNEGKLINQSVLNKTARQEGKQSMQDVYLNIMKSKTNKE